MGQFQQSNHHPLHQFATSGLLLLPVTLGWMGVIQAGWISLALIAVWLGLATAAQREYVRCFRRGLRLRTVETNVPINLSDIIALEILIESLGSADRRQVLHAMEILRSQGRGNLVPPLLLYHDDRGAFREIVDIGAGAMMRETRHVLEAGCRVLQTWWFYASPSYGWSPEIYEEMFEQGKEAKE